MLLEISIRNIALIEEMRLSFEEGLNVLTGETGAGKSIVVDSLALALGGRADRDLIRSGAGKASVTALFDVSGRGDVAEKLEEMGLEAEEGLLPVTREISENGRSICRIAGTAVPLSRMRDITGMLVDIHGQHEFQQLTDPSRHLSFIDAYGDSGHRALIGEVKEKHALWKEAKTALDGFRADMREKEQLKDILTFQIAEIDSVRPKPGEEEKLKQKALLLHNAEKISSSVAKAYHLVYQGGKSASAQESLVRAVQALDGIAGLDARFSEIRDRLNELFFGVQDVGLELQDIVEGQEFDPEEADRIGRRLNALDQLEKKYGPTAEDVLKFRDEAGKRLEGIEAGDEKLQDMERQEKLLREALHAAADRLTESRKALALTFTGRLLDELNDLGMPRTRFEVRFEKQRQCGAAGWDQVEFLISPNPGEPLKPLANIASGGELSRIMLGMKAIQADEGGVGVMIFDEIDTGISGRMAQVVAEKMAQIAGRRQVLCVTHLAQIACMADEQYLVEKTACGERTGTGVHRLSQQQRVQEIARMVSGAGD
ncbi:MAG: DNA repair protein RecN [Clostridia bacterium]|nr:DNA repair protein RecN [Clostridia bacterium]